MRLVHSFGNFGTFFGEAWAIVAGLLRNRISCECPLDQIIVGTLKDGVPLLGEASTLKFGGFISRRVCLSSTLPAARQRLARFFTMSGWNLVERRLIDHCVSNPMT